MNTMVSICCNGEQVIVPEFLKKLQESKQIIACDGAQNYLINNNILPNFCIGDMDSIEKEINGVHYIKVQDQNTNDLTKALDYTISQNEKCVQIFAASGKREDHFLGNISIMNNYIDKFDSIEMFTNYGYFTGKKENTCFEVKAGDYISFFTIDSFSHITTKGVEFEVKNKNFPNLNDGTLNRAKEKIVSVEVNKGGKYLVYFPL